jgi:hypothetical protein
MKAGDTNLSWKKHAAWPCRIKINIIQKELEQTEGRQKNRDGMLVPLVTGEMMM